MKVNAIHSIADDEMKAVQRIECHSSRVNELVSPALTRLATCSCPGVPAVLVRLRSTDVIEAMRCKQCKHLLLAGPELCITVQGIEGTRTEP